MVFHLCSDEELLSTLQLHAWYIEIVAPFWFVSPFRPDSLAFARVLLGAQGGGGVCGAGGGGGGGGGGWGGWGVLGMVLHDSNKMM